jgi:hypothetical protein
VKRTLICFFFYHKGIVHFKFLEQGWKVNQHCYSELMAKLREAVCRRRCELWPDAWILHHHNAPAHDALAVREFLAKKLILELDHPPYSPDLALCKLWLPKTEDRFEGPQIFTHCWHSGICDDHPEKHSRRGVPEMFWAVETPTH